VEKSELLKRIEELEDKVRWLETRLNSQLWPNSKDVPDPAPYWPPVPWTPERPSETIATYVSDSTREEA